VRIARIGWAKQTLQQGRVYAALYIGVASPEQANVIIEQGLYLGQVHHYCEPFFKECQINQCTKCYEYTHIAKYCPKGTYCGYCASKGHTSKDCTKKDTKEAHKCIVSKIERKTTLYRHRNAQFGEESKRKLGRRTNSGQSYSRNESKSRSKPRSDSRRKPKNPSRTRE
jgi:hypothetical protein